MTTKFAPWAFLRGDASYSLGEIIRAHGQSGGASDRGRVALPEAGLGDEVDAGVAEVVLPLPPCLVAELRPGLIIPSSFTFRRAFEHTPKAACQGSPEAKVTLLGSVTVSVAAVHSYGRTLMPA